MITDIIGTVAEAMNLKGSKTQHSDVTHKKAVLWKKAIVASGFLLMTLFLGTFVFQDSSTEVGFLNRGVPSFLEKHFSVTTQNLGSEKISAKESAAATTECNAVSKGKNGSKETCPDKARVLPKGLAHETSDLEMLPLWGGDKKMHEKRPQNLLAVPVGVKQMANVDKIVQKFPAENFTVMLFHYDGMVDPWGQLNWSAKAIHIAAINQTKWWFAKRFLHPDIISIYSYIFLWDEDLGVENFHAERYIKIMQEEGLEISQPALDPSSEVHHTITMRLKGKRVHRRMFKRKGTSLCFANSTAPPCTGWVEMMAPVFSLAAWRCSWGMIQNDLVHGWGLDMKLGYCAQGDRTQKVGVIDEEYVLHLGIPSLGFRNSEPNQKASQHEDARVEIRRQSYLEMKILKKRWEKAVKEDVCWIDPYS